jgi:superfamily II DNA or RNA helicase
MNPDFIQHTQPVAMDSVAWYPYSAKLERKLQFESRFGDLVSLTYHDQESDMLAVPRAICPLPPEDKNFIASGMQAKFDIAPIPRDYQKPIFEMAKDIVQVQKRNGIFVAPTGWGKTVLGCYLAYLTQRKTLVITTKEDIFEQWKESAKLTLGLDDSEIGEIRQSKCQVNNRKFVVSLVQSLSRDTGEKYGQWIYGAFGTVIYDECQRFSAPLFSSTIVKFPAVYRFGLSATPDRKDGKELLFESHIGPKLLEAPEELMIPKVMVVDTEWVCPRVKKFDKKTGKVKFVRVEHGEGRTGKVEKSIATDDDRNKLVAKFGAAAHAKGRDTVIFASTLLHLEQLEKALVRAGVPKKDIGFYVSESTKAGKAQREKNKVKPIKLATWQMMGEGTSIDWLDTAIFASPRADVRQPAGRIRRDYPDKRFPLLIDFVDRDSHIFRSYAVARRKWYESLNAEVENL